MHNIDYIALYIAFYLEPTVVSQELLSDLDELVPLGYNYPHAPSLALEAHAYIEPHCTFTELAEAGAVLAMSFPLDEPDQALHLMLET